MLTGFVGIADFKDLLKEYIDIGFKEDLAFYPMGLPINNAGSHNFACTNMIGKNWKIYRELKVKSEWGLAGTFNVMQFFIY